MISMMNFGNSEAEIYLGNDLLIDTKWDKIEEAFVIRLLSKTLSLKIIQAVIFSINTYEQDMISVGNEGKKKDIYNYFHHMPILPLLGANHRLPLLHMSKRFI